MLAANTLLDIHLDSPIHWLDASILSSMPPQLLSPAGLPGLSVYEAASDDSSPIMEHHHQSHNGVNHYLDASLPGAGGRNNSIGARHPSSNRPAAPPLKRTASTASVNEHIMDMLNPHKQAEEIARMNGSKSRKGRSSSVLSSDSEDGIGTLEDWEIEQDESPVAGQKRRRPAHEVEDKDPFTASPPVSGSSMTLESDAGPSSSPTVAVQKRRKSGEGLYSRGLAGSLDSDDDMDDADNNPFLDGPSTAPKAPSQSGSKVDHKKKISYVL